MDWLENISAGTWTALAAWLAVLVGIAALVYAWRQYKRVRRQSEELMQPNVAMFMEPAANDWHLVELVVKNFGRTPAYGIRFDFAHPPTVGKYEDVYDERYVDIVPLNLPAEIPYLAPMQEWRMVWDSALARRELGESIASRFDGAVTYSDRPTGDKSKKQTRNRFRSTAVLDWSTLHPVERLELLTTHDLARQEKQKLELLRHLLTYYHYAASESREDVLRREISQVRAAAEELRDRYRDEVQAPSNAPPRPSTRQSARPPANLPGNVPAGNVQPGNVQPGNVPPGNVPPGNVPPASVPPGGNAASANDDFDEAHTQVINGRHRHRLV